MSRSLLLSVGCLTAALVPTTLPAQEPKELKIIASATYSYPTLVRLEQLDSGVAIRSAQELVAHSTKPASAKDPAVQKAMESELAKRLRVDSIDWSKHMLLAVQGHPTKREREYCAIKLESPRIEGKILIVPWKQEDRVSDATYVGPPVGVGLVERFEGEVKFVPLAKK